MYTEGSGGNSRQLDFTMLTEISRAEGCCYTRIVLLQLPGMVQEPQSLCWFPAYVERSV